MQVKDFIQILLRDADHVESIAQFMCKREVMWALKEYATVTEHHLSTMEKMFEGHYPAMWVRYYVMEEIISRSKMTKAVLSIDIDRIHEEPQEAVAADSARIERTKTRNFLDETFPLGMGLGQTPVSLKDQVILNPLHMTDGIKAILWERNRQIADEGFSSEHDDQYQNEELERAAAIYAAPQQLRNMSMWPFSPEWYKPSPTRNRLRELRIAGALIAAAIDRLIRKRQVKEHPLSNRPENPDSSPKTEEPWRL